MTDFKFKLPERKPNLKSQFTEEQLRQLPGFDERGHKSELVNEFVEERNGQKTVIYRITDDLFQESLKRTDVGLKF